MCGRKTLTKDLKSIIEDLSIGEWEHPEYYSPSYNITPGQKSPILIHDEIRRVKWMQWGLIPSWANDINVGYKMINARSETLTRKPSYQGLVSKNRCIVIADGYYEWKREGKRKIPYYIHAPDRCLLTMAGLWTTWKNSVGKTVMTYTVITTEAKTSIRTVHHRMPVILTQELVPQWIGEEHISVSDISSFPHPFQGSLNIFPVSTLVNSPKNNVPDCIKPTYNSETLDMF